MQLTTLVVGVLLIGFAGVMVCTARASAATVNPALQQVLDQEICPALMKIQGQHVGGNCKDYNNQHDLDAAEHKICSAYPTKLKNQCADYVQTKASGITTPGGFSTGPQTQGSYQCGSGDSAVQTSIDIGCKGNACLAGSSSYDPSSKYCSTDNNPIADAAFAVIRILSDGVGLIIIASIVVGGIQYSASQGDPQATALAVKRLRSTLIALLMFIFGYAILNYIIPAGFLQ